MFYKRVFYLTMSVIYRGLVVTPTLPVDRYTQTLVANSDPLLILDVMARAEEGRSVTPKTM